MPWGKLHCRKLEGFKVKILNRNNWKFDTKCTIDYSCIKEIKWWINIPHCSAPIRRPNPSITITTDASKKGWGSVLNGVRAQGFFNLQERCYSINMLETIAIHLGLLSHLSDLKNQHILIMSDNTMAISYVQEMGGMESLLRDQISHKI